MRIGFSNGVFDCLHEGHRQFLKRCRGECDYLIIAVNSDRSVRWLKGPKRPIQSLSVRMMNLYPHGDSVIPFDGRITDLIRSIRPTVIFKGGDYAHKWVAGEQYAKVKILPRTLNISTTQIVSELRTSP